MSINNNYFYLLNLKPKYSRFITISLLMVIILIYFFKTTKIYSKSAFYAVSDGGYLYINVNIEDSDAVNNIKFIEINNKKFSCNIEEISEIKIEEATHVNYQTYKLSTEDISIDNQIKKVIVYYNYNYLYKKIARKIFGKEYV